MLLTPSRAEERVWQLVRGQPAFRMSATHTARVVGCDDGDAEQALDELVQRGILRRFDVPGERPLYWS